MIKYFKFSNFGKKPLPVQKIVTQWTKLSDKLDTNKSVKSSRQSMLSDISKMVDKDKNNIQNVSLLTKEFTDNTGKKRKVSTGLAYIKPGKFDKNEVYVSYLAGNPKSNLDKRFSGATKSLGETLKKNYLVEDGKRVGSRYFTMAPTTKESREIYINVLGGRDSPSGMSGNISSIPIRMREIDRLPLKTTFSKELHNNNNNNNNNNMKYVGKLANFRINPTVRGLVLGSAIGGLGGWALSPGDDSEVGKDITTNYIAKGSLLGMTSGALLSNAVALHRYNKMLDKARKNRIYS